VASNLSQTDLQKISAAIGVPSTELNFELLSGGLLARSYRISCDLGEWVVRKPAEAGADTALALSAEQELLDSVAAAGLAPKVVSCDDLLISQFLPGARAWCAEDAREPGNIVRVAERLRALHKVKHRLPRYSALRVVKQYLTHLGDQKLNSEQRRWAQELLALVGTYDDESSPGVLCHNDLVAANILDDGELWFIDFEYAVYSDPRLDLASLISMNGFNTVQSDALVAAYYGDEAPAISALYLSDVVRLTQLVGYFWALTRSPQPSHSVGINRFVEQMEAVLR
jgi:thiamine kinase-like enzyme